MRPLLILLLAAPAFAHPAPPAVRNWTAAVLPSREPPLAECGPDPLMHDLSQFAIHFPAMRWHRAVAQERLDYLRQRACMEYDRPGWGVQTEQQYRVADAWWHLINAADADHNLDCRRESMAILRGIIGDEAFELGVMPEPVVGMGE